MATKKNQIQFIVRSVKMKHVNYVKGSKKQKHPEIVDLDNKIKKLSLQLSLAILRSDDPDKTVQEYKDKITDLRAEKCELLVSKGYTPDYLSLHYECSKCKDTGFIDRKPCSCYKEKLVNLYYENS